MDDPTHPKPASPVALLPWGDVIEEFLDPLGISLEEFCEEMTGGWLFGYIEALKRVGVRTIVFCVSVQVDAPLRRTHRGTGATICFLPAPKSYFWLRAVLGSMASYLATPMRLLAREIRRSGCQIILCQEYEYARFDVSVALGKLLGLPAYGTFQGGKQRGRLEGILRQLSMSACAGIIAASRTELERVRAEYEMPARKLARIFNPLDLTEWRAMPRDQARAALDLPKRAKVVVWHGRVDMHRKGLDVLLEAWRQVCRKRTAEDLRLLLVGTGRDAEKLRHRLTTLELDGITWIDEYVLDREAIRRYLSAANVYVLPSRHEGLPVAPIEAMACGLPVVAADAPGVPAIFEPGESAGGLVVPREEPAALARELGQVLDDNARRRQLGSQARRHVEENFSLEAVGHQLHTFFQE